jgi:hypothetical protein
MKLTRYARLPLLLLFTLLQSVAPVAHAHVNGQHADQHVHLAYLDHLDAGGNPPGLPQLSVETGHSSVVSMPPEYRPAEHAVLQAPALADDCIFALRENAVQRIAPLPRLALPFLPYQHPCSRAPPA